MNRFTRLILTIAVLMFSTGCAFMQKDADGNFKPINFSDGTWSSCTFAKPGGATTTLPMQLMGAPLERTEADGTSVKCVPIPAVQKDPDKLSKKDGGHSKPRPGPRPKKENYTKPAFYLVSLIEPKLE